MIFLWNYAQYFLLAFNVWGEGRAETRSRKGTSQFRVPLHPMVERSRYRGGKNKFMITVDHAVRV
jgi:hypothetical protein